MPKPQLYSMSTLRTLFDTANTFKFPSEDFKKWRDLFLQLEELNQNQEVANLTEQTRQEQRKKISFDLEYALRSYINKKTEKKESDRSVAEENRLDAAKIILSYAKATNYNSDETLTDLEDLRHINNTLGTMENQMHREALPSTSYTLKELWQKLFRDKYPMAQNDSMVQISDAADRTAPISIDMSFLTLLHNNEDDLSSIADALNDESYRSQAENLMKFCAHCGVKVPVSEEGIELNFAPVMKNIQRIRTAVQRNGSSETIRDRAEVFLNSDELKKAVKTEITRYNLQIQFSDFGQNDVPDMINVPEQLSGDFFNQLKEASEKIGGPEKLTKLLQTIEDLKQIVERKKNGPETNADQLKRIENYTQELEKQLEKPIQKDQADNMPDFNPLDSVPDMVNYANHLVDHVVRQQLTASTKDLDNNVKPNIKPLRTYLEKTVQYINRIHQNDKSKQISFENRAKDQEYFECLEGWTSKDPEYKPLNEAAQAMKALNDLVMKEEQIQDYKDLAAEFKEDIDKSSFPSDQFKAMRTQFKKLASSALLPDPAERKAAFQRLYEAACDYLEYKDPEVNTELKTKLSPYEKSRVNFAHKLRDHCKANGADPSKYKKDLFETYEARKNQIRESGLYQQNVIPERPTGMRPV